MEETPGIATSTGEPYAIRAITGKGKGLVATTRIAKGTRLLSEVPIFRVPRDTTDIEALERIVANEVKCLSDDQQRTFFDLTENEDESRARIFAERAYDARRVIEG
jgi:hypothetical protein